MDDRSVVESSAKDGQKVHATINSKGWQEVIQPALEERKKALVHNFLDAVTYEEFVRVQQSLNAINGLLNFIEVKLMEGKEALREIKDDVGHP